MQSVNHSKERCYSNGGDLLTFCVSFFGLSRESSRIHFGVIDEFAYKGKDFGEETRLDDHLPSYSQTDSIATRTS